MAAFDEFELEPKQAFPGPLYKTRHNPMAATRPTMPSTMPT